MRFGEIVERLNRQQSKGNWEALGKSLKASGMKYYSIKFEKGKVNELEDLRKAYAQLHSPAGKVSYRIPGVMANGKKVRGATIYLMGLTHLNNPSQP